MRNRLVNMSSLIVGFCVILIVQLPVALSDGSETENDGLDRYMPKRWRMVSPKFQPPQIELRLLKSHVSPENGKMSSTIEYVISHNESSEKQNDSDKSKENEKSQKGEKTGKEIPSLGSRTIFNVPSFVCPDGQLKDQTGKCREIFDVD